MKQYWLRLKFKFNWIMTMVLAKNLVKKYPLAYPKLIELEFGKSRVRKLYLESGDLTKALNTFYDENEHEQERKQRKESNRRAAYKKMTPGELDDIENRYHRFMDYLEHSKNLKKYEKFLEDNENSK